MPRKTREEKILARLHRLEKVNTPVDEPESPESEPVKKSSGVSIAETKPTKTIPTIAVKHDIIDYSYVRADLIKTIILTVAALSVEIILSLTIGKH